MASPTPPRRRWFRFSLRTLFVLVTVLGVFSAWLAVQVKWASDRRAKLEWLSSKKSATVQSGTAPWPIFLLQARGVANITWCITGPYGVEDIKFSADREAQRNLQMELEQLFPEAKVEFVHCW